jgi:hypothetical protein
MQPVRLETSDGSFVYDGVILPFLAFGEHKSPFPRVVLWGERIFMIHEEPEPVTSPSGEAAARLGAPAIYREVFFVAVLPPESASRR